MTIQHITEKLSKQAPSGHKLNHVIPFSYPVRKIRMEVLADKQPDGSLVKMYSVMLKSIKAGMNSRKALFEFLGLGETDEFILRELFFLREKGYLNLFVNNWMVTEAGEQFIEDNAKLRNEEIEKFDFLIDGISGEVLSWNKNTTVKQKLDFSIDEKLNLEQKSIALVEGKFQAISDTYKTDKDGKSYLISYTTNEIERDSSEWLNFYLIEYAPENDRAVDPKIEIREYTELLTENKTLTIKFNGEYRNYYHQLAVKSLQKMQSI